MNRKTQIICSICLGLFGIFNMIKGFQGLFGTKSRPTPAIQETYRPVDNRPLSVQLEEMGVNPKPAEKSPVTTPETPK